MTNPSHKDILIIKAKEDLLTAESLVKLVEYSEEIVLFHCQQAVEKALKAYLDATNIIYPKTHDLETVLSICIEKDSSFDQIKSITSLTSYAVDMRYDEFVTLSEEEINKTVAETKNALDFILKKIKK